MRFADAKMWGATDLPFERKYNYLIDLLDSSSHADSFGISSQGFNVVRPSGDTTQFLGVRWYNDQTLVSNLLYDYTNDRFVMTGRVEFGPIDGWQAGDGIWFAHHLSGGISYFDISPASNSNNAWFRLFRNTTAPSAGFQILPADGSGSGAVFTVDAKTGNIIVGSATDGASASLEMLIRSQGFAGLKINGDVSNLSGEPGGSYIKFAIDGTGDNSILGHINIAGEAPDGSSYSGTAANSMLFGTVNTNRVQIGVNRSVVAIFDSSGNFSITGDMTGGNVPWARLTGHVSVSAGNGLTGGGALSATRTLTMGTPSSVTNSSTNNVSTSSHAHELATDAVIQAKIKTFRNDYSGTLNAGLIINVHGTTEYGFWPCLESASNIKLGAANAASGFNSRVSLHNTGGVNLAYYCGWRSVSAS